MSNDAARLNMMADAFEKAGVDPAFVEGFRATLSASDEAWRGSYDAWKTRNDRDDYWDGEDEEGCTCPRELGAGGHRKTDEWCPLHGRDPDAEREKMRDDR